MALTWDLSKVENHDEICFYEAPEDDPSNGVKKGERVLHPVTWALIWASISVDLGGITEANAEQWFARLRLVETLFGPMLIRGSNHEGPPEITADEVRAHIGLSVNVSVKSDAQWRKRQLDYAMKAYAASYRRAAEAAEEAVAATI